MTPEQPHASNAGSGSPAEASTWALDWVARRMPGAVYRCTVDDGLTMLALTDRFEALTGYPVAALIGSSSSGSYTSLIHADDRSAVIEALRRVVETGEPCELEYRLVRADQTELWIRQEAWRADTPERTVEGFLFDVTERRRAQRAQAEQQLAHARQQRYLFEFATHPAVTGGQFEQLALLATEGVARLVGVERVSIWLLDDTGEQLELIDLFVASAASHTRDLLLSARDYPVYFEALRSGRTVDAHDVMSDPRTHELAEHYLGPLGIGAMLDAAIRIAGDVVGVICLEHVGEARRWHKLEIDFAGEIADQLSLALLNRARITSQTEQDDLRAQLMHSQKMDALGRLAGGVAHDFNNVLMAISGNAELLAALIEDPTLHRSAEEIVDASFRAGELVGQLLRFARREPIELRTLDLGEVVRRLEGMLRRLLAKRLGFEVRVPSTPILVRATETMVQQVLTNLVANARDAVGESGRIVVELDVVDVEATARAGASGTFVRPSGSGSLPRVPAPTGPRSYARMRVTDDGPGMSAEVRTKAFEPFFTTKRPGEGTGLGLATVYSVVRACDGTVDVESAPGRGTTVTVLLPAAE